MLPDWEILLRLAAAAGLGSLIGFERERLLWAAGIRTHMLVCVGSCLFMIVSAFGFADAVRNPNVVLDPSRVAAQVVSGIGFLGAGSILLRNEVVKGLTTAASIWSVAAIGLAVGGGLYFAAAASTVIILVILAGVKPLEEAYRARNQSCRMHIECEKGNGFSAELLRQTLKLRPSQIKRFVVERQDPDGDTVSVLVSKVSAEDIRSFAARLKELDSVRNVVMVGRS
ncbi:MgtC/SapB family protein [Bradyrhizobium sp. LHD-71]|uniref:MgtC/SapB family protein n=1 Tax=Bradyrhizobium sp. LHD-71 TaxID=3072141 RepID=UPI00280EE20F|nr:MgtC/SapB family protein [Bradyrhizobium sp. LHD-71]MDQ8731820.1 MgtC/SapB family protein [Bradyrhizobium sp. LHD-71]